MLFVSKTSDLQAYKDSITELTETELAKLVQNSNRLYRITADRQGRIQSNWGGGGDISRGSKTRRVC